MKRISIDQLTTLREKTDAVSKILGDQLQSYLETLKPLFAPRRILGRHVGSRDDVNASDATLSRLKELYQQASQAPFGLPIEFPDSALSQLDNLPVVYPWEYTYTATVGKDSKVLTITSPVRWILTYDSGLSLSHLRVMLDGKGERRTDALRQFMINSLVIQLLVKAFQNIGLLLAALRYKVQIEALPGLGHLPFVTIQACLDSFRPPDDLLLTATRFSGVPVFVELIDPASLKTFTAPLYEQIRHVLDS